MFDESDQFSSSFVCCDRKLFTTWQKHCFCWLSLVISLVWNSDTRPKVLSAKSLATLKHCIIFLAFWYSDSSGYNRAGLRRKKTPRFKKSKSCHESTPTRSFNWVLSLTTGSWSSLENETSFLSYLNKAVAFACFSTIWKLITKKTEHDQTLWQVPKVVVEFLQHGSSHARVAIRILLGCFCMAFTLNWSVLCFVKSFFTASNATEEVVQLST